MDISIINLFEHVRSKVTEQDIIDFSPSDPGYYNYVGLWTEILRTGSIPQKTEFDLSEVIMLIGCGDAEKYPNPDRFKTCRRFTSAVGLALLHSGNCSESFRPAHYLARDLLIDLDDSDSKHLGLLTPVFTTTREVIKSCRWEEDYYPFFTFGLMILAQKSENWEDAEKWAEQLITDEGELKNEQPDFGIEIDHFLLDRTYYDTHHGDWLSFAKSLKNPNKHEATQLVIDALTK